MSTKQDMKLADIIWKLDALADSSVLSEEESTAARDAVRALREATRSLGVDPTHGADSITAAIASLQAWGQVRRRPLIFATSNRRMEVISNEVTRPDGQPVSITFIAGLPGPFDGPCIFLMADGSIHAGEVLRSSKTFPAGALSTTNPAGGFHEKFEIPLRKVIGWANAGPRDDRASLATAAV